jgi:pimeloyl-ACP methyl ester carboxylesterase
VADRRAGVPRRRLGLPDRRDAGGGRAHRARGRAIAVPRPILIHGSGGDHRVWGLQTARLGGAVAVDLPGHPDGQALDRLEALAEALAPAIESIAGPRVLVGHSLGGAAALELARARPDLVDGLVVIASGARLPVPGEVLERVRADPAGERRRLMEWFIADPDRPIAREVRAALEACDDATLAADYAACAAVDLRGRLAGLRAPALVIAGGDDRLTPPWLSEELARELPMAQTVLVPGARHMAMADADGTVNLLAAAFLARLELTLAGL